VTIIKGNLAIRADERLHPEATLSIYQKTCPACLAIVSVSAARCDCGHVFAAGGEAAPDGQDEASAQEEELYRVYLAARIEQTVSRLEEARARLAADPHNFDRAREVMKALHELRELRAEEAAVAGAAQASTAAAADGTGSAEPTEAFRAAQAARAEAALTHLDQVPTQECPSCHARLPASCARCFCGYLFTAAAGNAPARGVRAPSATPTRPGLN
jgi:hypothetical protein